MKINVKVVPFSKKPSIEKVVDMFGDVIFKVKLCSPPEDGKANQELISLLAKHFNLNKSSIKIVSGEFSRSKIIEILP